MIRRGQVRRWWSRSWGALVIATTLAWATNARSRTVQKDRIVEIQVLSTNDFHGRLNPQTVNGAPVGSAAWLAAYLERAEAENAKGTLLIVDGGDLVGARPLESQYFEDRPTIDVANAIG
jgi:5'-nucleotidase